MRMENLVAPLTCDWHAAAKAADGDALGNDAHSNCVPSGALRGLEMMRAVVASDQRRPTAAMSLDLYRQWADWDGTEATDIGTASDVAAARWMAHGVRWCDQFEDVPNALAWLDPTNLEHLRIAIAFLGPVQLDLNLPKSIDKQPVWMPADGPDGVPGSLGAHRVCVGKYDRGGLYCVTWGEEVPMTPQFVAKYGLNAMAVVSRSWLSGPNGISPANLDLAALERDSAALAA
jgi:hypothetical protein